MRRSDVFKGASAVARHWRSGSLGATPWSLRWQPVCTSTEISLSKWLEEDPWDFSRPRACIAGKQNGGFGQRGRSWQSPRGGVWLSAAIPWVAESESAGLLGLTVALAMAERLERRGLEVTIKWPNDLLIAGRKTAGILPKLIRRGSQVRFACVGLGLNVSNRVPLEGTALVEWLQPCQCQPSVWTAEVLWALERAMKLADKAELVRDEVERRLWTWEVIDPKDGERWEVVGLELGGALRLKRGFLTTSWIRWG